MARTGQRFTHKHFLQPGWKPGPGEKYKNGPKAEMVVTRVKMHTVFYRYAGETHAQRSRAAWAMDRAQFDRTYPDRCEEEVPDGPDPDDTDICSTLLSPDGTCPNAAQHR